MANTITLTSEIDRIRHYQEHRLKIKSARPITPTTSLYTHREFLDKWNRSKSYMLLLQKSRKQKQQFNENKKVWNKIVYAKSKLPSHIVYSKSLPQSHRSLVNLQKQQTRIDNQNEKLHNKMLSLKSSYSQRQINKKTIYIKKKTYLQNVLETDWTLYPPDKSQLNIQPMLCQKSQITQKAEKLHKKRLDYQKFIKKKINNNSQFNITERINQRIRNKNADDQR